MELSHLLIVFNVDIPYGSKQSKQKHISAQEFTDFANPEAKMIELDEVPYNIVGRKMATVGVFGNKLAIIMLDVKRVNV